MYTRMYNWHTTPRRKEIDGDAVCRKKVLLYKGSCPLYLNALIRREQDK